LAWRFGWLERLTKYVQETREELRKCTWPSYDELWGSTVLVMVATGLLGVFTVVVELVMTWVVSNIV
jgi:preprotein translocase subunit SecE